LPSTTSFSSAAASASTAGKSRSRPSYPPANSGRLLGIDSRTAAFSLTRTATAAGQPVEWWHTLVRGDRYSFLATWSPSHPYRLDLVPAPAEDRPT
jgi:GntR family transcriptional regulator